MGTHRRQKWIFTKINTHQSSRLSFFFIFIFFESVFGVQFTFFLYYWKIPGRSNQRRQTPPHAVKHKNKLWAVVVLVIFVLPKNSLINIIGSKREIYANPCNFPILCCIPRISSRWNSNFCELETPNELTISLIRISFFFHNAKKF